MNKIEIQGRLVVKPLLCYKVECDNCKLKKSSCLRETHKMRILKPITFVIPGVGKLRIKKGFIFDGASIPQLFWSSTGSPFDFQLLLAALIHDAFYATELINRLKADQLFREHLQHLGGVNWYRRNKIYYAVRFGGAAVWNTHTKATITEARKFIEFTSE